MAKGAVVFYDINDHRWSWSNARRQGRIVVVRHAGVRSVWRLLKYRKMTSPPPGPRRPWWGSWSGRTGLQKGTKAIFDIHGGMRRLAKSSAAAHLFGDLRIAQGRAGLYRYAGYTEYAVRRHPYADALTSTSSSNTTTMSDAFARISFPRNGTHLYDGPAKRSVRAFQERRPHPLSATGKCTSKWRSCLPVYFGLYACMLSASPSDGNAVGLVRGDWGVGGVFLGLKCGARRRPFALFSNRLQMEQGVLARL